MNILFISYWGLNEGLTQATILPHLKILSSMENIGKVFFTTIERDAQSETQTTEIPKVQHVPLRSKKNKLPLSDKLNDFITFPKVLARLCKENNIEKIICRGAPAGALGLLVHGKTKLPFYVESYEPHAQYMLESNVWKKKGIRFQLQQHWENKIEKKATSLMPVSNQFKQELINRGVDEKKVDVMPCSVDSEQFSFKPDQRDYLREKLGIKEDDVVFVYVGKFGGLYVEEEAFELFSFLVSKLNKVKILVLSPNPQKYFESFYSKFPLLKEYMTIMTVPHDEVSAYLSAADVALALYKQGLSKKYLSPIKIGEYWSVGLPVIIPKGVGDDAEIIAHEGGGYVLEDYSASAMNDVIQKLKVNKFDRDQVQMMAKKYRNFDITRKVYAKWYGKY